MMGIRELISIIRKKLVQNFFTYRKKIKNLNIIFIFGVFP